MKSCAEHPSLKSPLRRRWRHAVWALVLPALLSACGGPRKLGGDPGLQVRATGELPPPTQTDLQVPGRPYFVGPFDKLSVEVFGIAELPARTVQVDSNGRLSYPLAGSLAVAGKTTGEIEELLTRALRASHIRDPQVTVNVAETLSQVVTVEGQVGRPGLYPVSGELTLLRAVAQAQGTADLANPNDVVIFRTVDGQRMAALYSLEAIRNGVYRDPEVFPNDVVSVGTSRGRLLFRDFLQSLPALTTPLILIDRVGRR